MTQERGELIPTERWADFFEELSERWQGLRATVETWPAGGARRTVAGDEPFAGLTIDAEEGVLIDLGGGVSFSAGMLTRVRYEESLGGGGHTVTFEATDGTTTRLALDGGIPLSRAVAGDDIAGVGGSSGAAGGSVAGIGGRTASGAAAAADEAGLVNFGSSDDMGGVAAPQGGSMADRDLSGAGAYDITADVYDGPTPEAGGQAGSHAGPGSETAAAGQSSITDRRGTSAVGMTHLHPDVIDGGSGQGLIDTGIDPIEGGPVAPGTDDDDDMVEGEVGPQAERDLTELFGRRPEQADKPDEDSPGVG